MVSMMVFVLNSKVEEAQQHDRLTRAPSPLPAGWEERNVSVTRNCFTIVDTTMENNVDMFAYVRY